MTPSPLPHAPLGALASFDFGPVGAPAGYRLSPHAEPAPAQDVYVGCRASGRESWSLLPFFTPIATGPQPLPKGRYGRFLAWAGDKWMIGPLVFKLCTPFSAMPAADVEEETFRYAPVVCAYLEYDNSHGDDTAELIFGLGGLGAATALGRIPGFAFGGVCGFATAPSDEVSIRLDRGLFDAEIGSAAALHFAVPPHEKRIYPLVLGFFQPGFCYGRYFTDLDAVLRYGIAAHARYVATTDARDAEFMRSSLAFEVKGRAAHAVREWLAQTHRAAGEPEIDLAPLRELCRAVTGG